MFKAYSNFQDKGKVYHYQSGDLLLSLFLGLTVYL